LRSLIDFTGKIEKTDRSFVRWVTSLSQLKINRGLLHGTQKKWGGGSAHKGVIVRGWGDAFKVGSVLNETDSWNAR
jgi:hypothetical protein